MTSLKLSQSWIDSLATDKDEIDVIIGTKNTQIPSNSDHLSILKSISNTNQVKEMVRRRWFSINSENDQIKTREKALYKFLFMHQSDRQIFASTCFRQQHKIMTYAEELIIFAWLKQVKKKANEVKDIPFNPEKVERKAIDHLIQLSTSDTGPQEAITYLAQLGVTVIIENGLPGMRVDGASFIHSNGNPVISLTLKYDRLDNFWFTIMHELGHILLHLQKNPKNVFVDSLEEEDLFESEIEAEADAFAKDMLIPRDIWMRSDAYRIGNVSSIKALSQELNINSAIVAGRLRFEKKMYKKYSHLLGQNKVRKQLLME